MLIERRGAKRSHRHVSLACAPAQVLRADATNSVIFMLQGDMGYRIGAPLTRTQS
jgi:hypothetical protein